MAPGGMAPEEMLKTNPTALGSSIISNSRQRSGLETPQHCPCLEIAGEVQAPDGFPTRLTEKKGVFVVQFPDWE